MVLTGLADQAVSLRVVGRAAALAGVPLFAAHPGQRVPVLRRCCRQPAAHSQPQQRQRLHHQPEEEGSTSSDVRLICSWLMM